MSSLALYRTMVPAHVDVGDAVVETFLGLSAQQHSSSAWGAVYAQAMVWHAAHTIETTPGLVPSSSSTGAGTSSAQTRGPLVSQRDCDLAMTFANPNQSSGGTSGQSAEDQRLASTAYGTHYLQLRRGRAVRAGFHAGGSA